MRNIIDILVIANNIRSAGYVASDYLALSMAEQASEQATPNRVLGCSRLNLFSMLDEQETTCSRKCRKPAKSIPKKKRQDLLKSLRSVELNNLRAEIRTAVEEQFADSSLRM